MDTIINKISDIESAAAAIMEDANVRKKAFAEEMDQKTAAFDKELEAETAAKLEALRSRMEVEMQKKLAEQKAGAEKILELMVKNYESHHESYARELFQAMIKE